MPPFVRRLALMIHIITSIGWIGAVAVYLALAITVLTSQVAHLVGAAYLAMQIAVWRVIVPLSFGSFLSGLVMSLGTPWGLFRHYWVIFKLVLNVFAITILVLYTRSIGSFATLAAKDSLSVADLHMLRDPTHVVHTVGALVVLLIATTLSVYKPRGLTKYGMRKQRDDFNRRPPRAESE